MQFIQEHDVNKSLLERFEDVLQKTVQEFEPSQVYNSVLEEKLIKPELRLSEFRTLTDPELFNLCDILITEINKKQPINGKTFLLYRNDVMHIKYSPGGYFKEHEDYLSVTSNFIEEYSLLICIEGSCNPGSSDFDKITDNAIILPQNYGRTLIKLSDFCTYKSEATCTKGRCLLFRKDIQHEGETLVSGHKQILTFNLWAMDAKIDRILTVVFENSKLSYNLPINLVANHSSGEVLKTFLTTDIGKKDINSKVLVYKCHHIYEEFSVIYDIYNGMAISYEQLRKYSSIIDYYFTNYNNLLVKSFQNFFPVREDRMLNIVTPANEKLILCGYESDYLAFLNEIKQKKLPFIPFKIILAEGSLSYGGGMDGTDPTLIDMRPVYMAFSENENIFFLQNIMGKNLELGDPGDCSFMEGLERTDEFEELADDTTFIMYNDEEPANNLLPTIQTTCFDYYFQGQCMTGDLAFYLENPTKAYLIDLITSRGPKLVFNKAGEYDGEVNDVYVITPDDKLFINSNHYGAITDKVKVIGLSNLIKANINNLLIPNSQRNRTNVEENYCNESVYANFNLLCIYGFLNMD